MPHERPSTVVPSVLAAIVAVLAHIAALPVIDLVLRTTFSSPGVVPPVLIGAPVRISSDPHPPRRPPRPRDLNSPIVHPEHFFETPIPPARFPELPPIDLATLPAHNHSSAAPECPVCGWKGLRPTVFLPGNTAN